MNINKIENDNKVNVFLALIGASAFELLVLLVTPDDVAGKSYNDLTKLLEVYYKPKHSVVGERYIFGSRNQQENESVTDFILTLKKLSVNCEFGDSLKNTLRDRLFIGIRSSAIKTRLFSLATTTDLTWDKACSEAQAMKLAHNETKLCQSTPIVTQRVNRITKKWSDSPKSKQIKWRTLTNSVKHVIAVMVSIIQTVVMPRNGHVINVPKLDILLKHVNHHDIRGTAVILIRLVIV
ncbi:hypothetical protein LSH36_152g00042 [Paralvinella palmiformis]|uniref:Uncharacterized protein n=1 Tax=Paralvinella palmiformis TaxID=53620 RepID=A0AAD9JVZ4_9ANNE|nr:hypothetical protein LSH36_152g00042 [Paralvinella palmiformis]